MKAVRQGWIFKPAQHLELQTGYFLWKKLHWTLNYTGPYRNHSTRPKFSADKSSANPLMSVLWSPFRSSRVCGGKFPYVKTPNFCRKGHDMINSLSSWREILLPEINLLKTSHMSKLLIFLFFLGENKTKTNKTVKKKNRVGNSKFLHRTGKLLSPFLCSQVLTIPRGSTMFTYELWKFILVTTIKEIKMIQYISVLLLIHRLFHTHLS